jgi:lipopolysaccharide transport system ATP-binding protein
MTILSVHNLGKAYKQYFNRWSRLAEWCLPSVKPRYHLHWALQNVNFQIEPGEAMGIVGMNGAGKSTLLKIIAGTTQPTTGSIEMNGRLAALLELGMGFHYDFTGRQNAMMAGQLLGFSVPEILDLLPKIEAFAEIGDYIDLPVRTYSSGMQMRLAFAVATARRPDVLIVDEALAVGDAYFQQKSFSRIREFREEGTTLLLVSHDVGAILSICDRVALLHAGTMVKEGNPEEAIDFYRALLAEQDMGLIRQERQASGRVQTTYGHGEMTVLEIRLLDMGGRPLDAVETGTVVTLEIRAKVNRPVSEAVVGFMIKDRLGQIMYGINSDRLGRSIRDLAVGDQLVCCFQFALNLGKGNYSVSTALSRRDSHMAGNYEWRDGGFIFSVLNTKKPDFVGAVSLDATLAIRHKSFNEPSGGSSG